MEYSVVTGPAFICATILSEIGIRERLSALIVARQSRRPNPSTDQGGGKRHSSAFFLRRDVHLTNPETFYHGSAKSVSATQNMTDIATSDTRTFCKRDEAAITFDCRF
jgi:hypothetical protein